MSGSRFIDICIGVLLLSVALALVAWVSALWFECYRLGWCLR